MTLLFLLLSFGTHKPVQPVSFLNFWMPILHRRGFQVMNFRVVTLAKLARFAPLNRIACHFYTQTGGGKEEF